MKPTSGRLIALAAALGMGLGSSWPLQVLELGIVRVLLAAVGLLVTLARRNAAAFTLLLAFAVNLLGAAAAAGPGDSATLTTDLVEEGFLFGCYFVLAAWMAIGAPRSWRAPPRCV